MNPFFRHNWFCGLAVSSKNLFFGPSSRAFKSLANLPRSAPRSPKCQYCNKTPPPNPLPMLQRFSIYIPSWRIGRCSRTGATLAHATTLLDFYPGCSLSKISCVAHNMVQRYFTFFSAAATIVTPPSSNLVDSPPPRARPFPQRLSEGARGL